MITVVVIDSGISNNFEKEGTIIEGFSFSCSDGKVVQKDDYDDEIGHGTAIIDVLTSYSYCDKIKFVMIKIFDVNDEVEEDLLIYTLNYIYNNISCNLIHISNGITVCSKEHEMENICNLLLKRGTVIVSAFDNLGGISFPAAFENVIGVDYNFDNGQVFSFDYIENSIVNISARHSEQRLMWKDCKRKILQGNSFIAPHISALIINYICKNNNAGLNDVINFLKSKANTVCQEEILVLDTQIQPFDIKKACVFPFNKEIRTLARFEDLCDFEILHYYDSKYLGNCGKKVSDVLNHVNSDSIIENIDNIDWHESFDTFIIGHTDKLENMVNKKYTEKIIENCLKYNKNIFAFDKLCITNDIIQAFSAKNLNIYYPSVKNKKYNFKQGKLYSFSTPVLAVLGTSSKQGKFSLQLNLKKNLTKLGYNVGHLGTEPSSLLLNADDDYVMGYNSDNYTDSYINIIKINDAIHTIERKGYDLILIGSQSHTVPVGYCNIGMIPLYQQDILLASLPDACVLCVNYYDDISYIKRTIEYIESICETKVILLCVSKFGGTSRWTTIGNGKSSIDEEEVCIGKEIIKQNFDIPVFMYDETEAISDAVVDYFSEAN